MNPLFPDKIWNYKNFNMGTELDIAGEFIYDGINVLNQMNSINDHASLFSFLYHTAVGIERLQKIIIVLFEAVDLDNHEEFEKSLITHSHTKLNERICGCVDPKLNSRENRFLQMLTSFYNSARYDRFNLNSQFAKEREVFRAFLTEQMTDIIEHHPFDENDILITPRIREMLGRTIGSISKKYYELVRTGCTKAGTFTYEIRVNSKAEKVFRSTYNKNSLQMQKITEKIALKELLIYLRNTTDKHGLIHCIDNIEALDFDPALVNEYISEIANGTIPQTLVDDVESQYEDKNFHKERTEEVDIIGDPYVDFDHYPVHLCYLLMKELISENIDCIEFSGKFSELYEMIDEDYGCDVLDDVPELCERFATGKITLEEFISEIKVAFSNLKELYNY